VRFSVETWAPEYGLAADAEALEETAADVDHEVELPIADWAPIAPPSRPAPERIMFVDGVQRIDARIWVHNADRAHAGVCASFAAGVVTCAGHRAQVSEIRVRRALLVAARSDADPVVTRHGEYELVPTTSGEPDAVYFAIHQVMTSLELELAAEHGCEQVVFDGPLRGRNDPCGVGYVKTQRVRYLPDEAMRVLTQLGDGERTPLFLLGSGPGQARWSWYLRLPGRRAHPLSGIVRCEVPATGPVTDAVARADTVSATLPRFASAPHKEPRAPQNLYPIAGLEHSLRHRLGDALLLERALRIAAAGNS
jgi:hypothetical protein